MFALPPSPLSAVHLPIFSEKRLHVWMKRDDLLHPDISGNKWRKMKYNLIEARQQGFTRLMTFGGAYSNHLYATAAAGKVFGFQTLGIVRGDELHSESSKTLAFCAACGMELHFVSRTAYRDKPQILTAIQQENPIWQEAYFVPEGGSNALAIKGVMELTAEIYTEIQPDFLCTAVGTGGTLAGIWASAQKPTQLLGFLALKGAVSGISHELQTLVQAAGVQPHAKVELIETFCGKGYGKYDQALIDFIHFFEQNNPDIRLEQVYTGKMMQGIATLAAQDFFPADSVIVAIHTGGLQGRSFV